MLDEKRKQDFSITPEVTKPTTGNRIWLSVLFLVLLSLSVTSLMVLYIDRLPSNIQVGNIATQDIRADQNYEIVDIEATDKLRKEAIVSALPVYDFDTNLVVDRKNKIIEAFTKAREFLQKKIGNLNNATQTKNKKKKLTPKLSNEEEGNLKENFLLNLSLSLSDAEYLLIKKDGFSVELEKSLIAFYDQVQRRPVIHDRSDIELHKERGIVLRVLSLQAEVSEQVLQKYENIISLEQAKTLYAEMNAAKLQKKLNLEFIDANKINLALKLYPIFIAANLTINKVETESRRKRAVENVQEVIHKLQKGQIIIRRGDRYEPRHITVLQGIREARLQTNIVLKFLGVFFLVAMTLYIIFQFSYRHIKQFKPSRKDINFLGLQLILFLALLRLGSFIGSTMQDAVPFPVDIVTFYYVIPMAACAMMIRYILNAETAFVSAVVLSLFSGLFLEHNYQITAYYFLSSLLAASIIGHVERRSSVLRRGLYIGFVNVLLVLSLNLIGPVSTAATIDFQALWINCVFAFLGGVFSGLILLAVSPIMEALFNYTTNIQLVELANMNHPLLREMIVRAPGTYHHSQLMGILAEAGTRAINGNALLARVGSYYHDIGKMKKPQYFIENQKGENPHDNLSPSMSALIIEAHVKDGIDMAKESKLPKVIADFIPEHQGTKLIGYFYHKAKKNAEKDGAQVDEKDFRYKGPKPQSRESGVVMLADTVEAAVRSMPDKSPQKIQAQVEKLVNMHFVDGQLDECDLTLRDLHLIVDAFVKILVGIYHQRVEYPSSENKKPPAPTVETPDQQKKDYAQNRPPLANISPLFKEKKS